MMMGTSSAIKEQPYQSYVIGSLIGSQFFYIGCYRS